MAVNAKLTEVVLECPDPPALARFYADLTGWKIVESESDWATLADPTGGQVKIAFQEAPGYTAPTWPDAGSSMQYHLDFTIEDIEIAEQEALALGATRFDHQPGESFRVYADPAGHPFCLCW